MNELELVGLAALCLNLEHLTLVSSISQAEEPNHT
jgi:hypothetical protein